MHKPRLGFLGVGIMGSAMVQNLISAGYALAVWNRTPARLDEFRTKAKCLGSATQVAEECDVLLLSVSNGDAVEELLFGASGVCAALNKPKLVIDLSTIAPSEARRFAEALSSEAIGFLDAPVSGGDIGARNATLTVMVGGERSLFERAQPILSALGKNIVHTGPVGSGQVTKCVNQILVASSIAGMTEALVFAKRAGLDLETTLQIVSKGAAASWSLDNYAPRLLRGDFKPGFSAQHMLKDLRIAISETDKLDTALPVLALIKELFIALCSDAEADELGNHALIRLYENSFAPGNPERRNIKR